MKNIDDLDLLNSRNNIWKEAAKFLETNTNIPSQIRKFLEEHGLQNGVFKGNPQILAGLSVPANTFALPAGMAEQLNKAYSGGFGDHRTPSDCREFTDQEIFTRQAEGCNHSGSKVQRIGSLRHPSGTILYGGPEQQVDALLVLLSILFQSHFCPNPS